MLSFNFDIPTQTLSISHTHVFSVSEEIKSGYETILANVKNVQFKVAFGKSAYITYICKSHWHVCHDLSLLPPL